MCRFVAYIGKKPILLKELLEKHNNSLINQSKEAREGINGLNADGFGLAWYDQDIEPEPGIFKSIQPAWNDANLKHIASKIKSSCFLGHVRASTVGDVSINNCHPFTYRKYAFVHNGTIRHFEKVRRPLMNQLDDEFFDAIKAQTDSEHLFYLIMQCLKHNPNYTLEQAVTNAFKYIVDWQKVEGKESFSRLNIVITDGNQLVATRFVTKGYDSLSLHYAIGYCVDESEDEHLLITGKKSGAVIIASEPLTDYAREWQEVPNNHSIVINPDLSIHFKPI